MAKKKWPKINRTGKPVQVYVSEEELISWQALADRNGRSLSEEVRHAMARHLAEPPHLVVPSLSPVTLDAEKPAHRSRKKGGAS